MTISFSTYFDIVQRKFKVRDTTNYAGQGKSLSDVVGVIKINTPRGVTYDNTDYNNPDISPSDSLESELINLPVNSGGFILSGTYTVTYTVRETDGTISSQSYTYTYNVVIPEISITHTIDGYNSTFSSTDSTNYGDYDVTSTLHTVTPPVGSGLPTISNGQATITYSANIWSGNWVTTVYTSVQYVQGDGLILTGILTGSKTDTAYNIDMNLVRNYIDQLKDLYAAARRNNRALAERYENSLLQIAQDYAGYDLALYYNDLQDAYLRALDIILQLSDVVTITFPEEITPFENHQGGSSHNPVSINASYSYGSSISVSQVLSFSLANTSHGGMMPQLNNLSDYFLNGQGNWVQISGGGDVFQSDFTAFDALRATTEQNISDWNWAAGLTDVFSNQTLLLTIAKNTTISETLYFYDSNQYIKSVNGDLTFFDDTVGREITLGELASSSAYALKSDFAAYNSVRAITATNISNWNSAYSTSHAPVTLSNEANGLTITGQELTLVLATADNSGALDGADWTTFNSKLSDAPSNGNYYARRNGAWTPNILSTSHPANNVINSGLGTLFLADDNTYKSVLTIGGSTTQVMFNDAGALGGDANFTFNKTTDVLSVAGGVSVGSGVFTMTDGSIQTSSGDMTFTDANAGTVTLSDLLGGATNYWTQIGSDIHYSGGNVGVKTTTFDADFNVGGNIIADYFNSDYIRYKNSNILIGPNAGDLETGDNFVYIHNSDISNPIYKADMLNRNTWLNSNVYVNDWLYLAPDSSIGLLGDLGHLYVSDPDIGTRTLYSFMNGTINALVADFDDLAAVQSITASNKTTWNKASYINASGSGDSYLSDDGTYKVLSNIGNTTTLYLHDESSDISGYEKLLNSPANNPTEDVETVAVTSGTSPVLIDDYATEPSYPGLTTIAAGLWIFKTWLNVDSASGTTTVTIRVYKRAAGGTETELFNVTTAEINATSTTQYVVESVQPEFVVDATDRLVIKYYTSTTNPTAINVSLRYEGTAHYSYIITPLAFATTLINDYTFKWDTVNSYIRPYLTKVEAGGVASSGKFYSGTTNPSATNRLNYDGNLHVTNLSVITKLTVGGLIDPTGLQLTPVAANPGDANTIWSNSGASNALYYGANRIYTGLSSTSTTGALSDTDWNTFNGKQAGNANLTSLSGLSYASASFVKMTGANTFTLDTATYEPALGNPASDGYVLSSTAAGVRSWIEASGGVTPTDDILDWSTDKYTPYTTQQAFLSFDTSEDQPTLTDRLNLNGYLYATGIRSIGNNNEVAIYGYATGNGVAGKFETNSGSCIQGLRYGTLTGNDSSPLCTLQRTNSAGIYNITGNMLNITDNATVSSGTISGKILSATIGTTERISLNPRVADGASAVAYMFDTHNALSNAGARLLSIRNNGIEHLGLTYNGLLSTTSSITAGAINVNGSTLASNGRIYSVISSTSYIDLYPSITDGATAVAFKLSTSTPLETSGAKLLSILNNNSEKFYIDNIGNTHVYSLYATTHLRSDVLNTNSWTRASGMWYTGTTDPVSTDRLNYDGRLYTAGINAYATTSTSNIFGSDSGSAINAVSNTGIVCILNAGASSTANLLSAQKNFVDKAYINNSGKYLFTSGLSSTFAIAPGILKDFYTDASTSGTGETDLYSYTVPANVLVNDGDKLEFEAYIIASATSASIIRLYFGTNYTQIRTGAIVGTNYFHIKGRVTKISSDSIRINTESSLGSDQDNYDDYSSIDFTTSKVMKITASSASGSMTAVSGYIEYKPAAIN